jgi:Protein of unknown function (DUF1367)
MVGLGSGRRRKSDVPVTLLMRLEPGGGGLVPDSAAELESLADLHHGTTYRVELVAPRNPRFHRKLFALLRILFDAWEPPPAMHAGIPVARDFESFRDMLTILAGYHTPYFLLDGSVRLKPKSIAFARMDETTFDRLYSRVIDIALEHVPTSQQLTREQIDERVEAILRFA